MKTRQEIEQRIKDTSEALDDLNIRGNLSEELHTELNTKIEILKWVIK